MTFTNLQPTRSWDIYETGLLPHGTQLCLSSCPPYFLQLQARVHSLSWLTAPHRRQRVLVLFPLDPVSPGRWYELWPGTSFISIEMPTQHCLFGPSQLGNYTFISILYYIQIQSFRPVNIDQQIGGGASGVLSK